MAIMVPTTRTTGEARRVAYHHGDLAPALVAQALQMVRANGAESLSLRQVAQAVGVSPSAAYAHFADKVALLRAVAVEGERALDAALSAAVESVPGDDDLAALTRFLHTGEAYIAWATSEPHLFRHTFGPYCHYISEHPLTMADFHQMKGESLALGLVQLGIADLKRRGLLRADETEGLELLLWTSVHGFASLALDGHLPAQAASELFSAILRSICNERAHALVGELASPLAD